MPVKHRCGFCRKVLRSNGTCANEECPRYFPEVVEEETPATEEAQEKGGKK